MIDSTSPHDPAGAAGGLSDAELAGLGDRLAGLDQDVDDPIRIDRIRALEELKSAAAAAQARETAAFAASQRAAQRAAGTPAARADHGVAAQIGLARRISPWAAQRYTGWANILTRELPATFAALAAGRVSEWRAMTVARETAWLSREHRAAVDTELAPRLESWGDRRVEAEAKKAAYRRDPDGYLARIRGATSDRRVTVRPAPEVMARLSALLPVGQGVSCYATLRRDAEAARAAGDPRTLGQLMADLLVQRLTGQATATGIPVELNLVLTDATLFHPDTCPTTSPGHPDPAATDPAAADAAPGDPNRAQTAAPAESAPGAWEADPAEPAQQAATLADPTPEVPADPTPATTAPGCRGQEPAVLLGYGPIPAATARDLITGPGPDTPMWIRRLYTHPATGQLAAMDARRRLFTPTQRHFLTLRDQTCATPWCDAAIRHADHLLPAEHGGPTSISNGRGSCAACNYTKQAPGWTTTPTPADTGAGNADPCPDILTTTPTGHTYRSRPPDPPGSPPCEGPAVRRADQPQPRQPVIFLRPAPPGIRIRRPHHASSVEQRLAALLRAA